MSLFNIFSFGNKELSELVANTFANPPTLETDRLLLCKIVPEHAADMFEYSSDSEVTKYLTWSPHSSLKETERYINVLQKKYADGSFNDWGVVLKENARFIGTCGYTSFDYNERSAEVGYVLAKDMWGKGYAAEAVRAIMKYAIDNFGIVSFNAKHMEGNNASGRVMQKCGMKLDGMYRHAMYIKGEFKNIVVYKASKEDFLAIEN